MMGFRGLCIASVLASSMLLSGQTLPEPRKQFGGSLTGAFEGWYENGDGTRGFLVGYYNRNLQQELDIPIGPNNRIEPGGPDMGQPTHFLPSRQYGMFTIPVPNGFTRGGLPISLQIACRGYDEATTLRIGWAYEQAAGWRERKPALA